MKVLLHDDIDDTGYGVRAIYSRGTVFEYFYTFNGSRRDAVQIDGFPREAVIGDPAPIYQHQGVTGGQASKGNGSGAIAAIGYGGAGCVSRYGGDKF